MPSGLFYIARLGLHHSRALAKGLHETLQNLYLIFQKCYAMNKHRINHIAHAQKDNDRYMIWLAKKPRFFTFLLWGHIY